MLVGHKKEVKEKFIKIAQDCFTRYGFKKTTMNDIAHAAGKAKSSLYYYFKSKEEIIEAIVNKEVKILREEITLAVNKETDPQKKLFAYIITRFTAVIKVANCFNLLKDDYIENYASFEKIHRQYDKNEQQAILAIFQYGLDQGAFVIPNLDLLVETLVLGLKGFELEWIDTKNLPWLKGQIGNLLDTLFYGIVKR